MRDEVAAVRKKWPMRACMAAAVLAVLLTAAGCGSSEEDERVRAYGDDGFLGLTDTNPNLPGRRSYWNYGDDAALARETLGRVEGVKSVRIYFNPPWMEVRIKTAAGLDAARQQAVLDEARAVAAYNFGPRYKVRVKKTG